MLAESQISAPQGVRSVSVVVNGSLVVDGEGDQPQSKKTLALGDDRASHVIRIMQGSHVIHVDDGTVRAPNTSDVPAEMGRMNPHTAVLRVPDSSRTSGQDIDERSSSGASSASDHSDSDSDGQGHDSGFGELRTSLGCACQDGASSAAVSVCPANSGVRFIVASYGTDTSTTNPPSCPEPEMKFHVNELADSLSDRDSPATHNTNHEDTRIQTPPSAIISGKGTVRGMKDRVRASVAHLAYLLHREGKRDYTREEEGRVVVYTTSMGIVRKTYEQCRRVKNILHTLMVRFEERDVFMNRAHQQEVMERVCTTAVVVPQVFVDGRILGSADVIERLNETGELRQLLRPYKKTTFGKVCPQCGGYRYLPCPLCGGSKKSTQYRHNFSDMYVSLRCMNCDESGLIRCDLCLDGDC